MTRTANINKLKIDYGYPLTQAIQEQYEIRVVVEWQYWLTLVGSEARDTAWLADRERGRHTTTHSNGRSHTDRTVLLSDSLAAEWL